MQLRCPVRRALQRWLAGPKKAKRRCCLTAAWAAGQQHRASTLTLRAQACSCPPKFSSFSPRRFLRFLSRTHATRAGRRCECQLPASQALQDCWVTAASAARFVVLHITGWSRPRLARRKRWPGWLCGPQTAAAVWQKLRLRQARCHLGAHGPVTGHRAGLGRVRGRGLCVSHGGALDVLRAAGLALPAVLRGEDAGRGDTGRRVHSAICGPAAMPGSCDRVLEQVAELALQATHAQVSKLSQATHAQVSKLSQLCAATRQCRSCGTAVWQRAESRWPEG